MAANEHATVDATVDATEAAYCTLRIDVAGLGTARRPTYNRRLYPAA